MTTLPVLYPDTDHHIDAPPLVRLLGRTVYAGHPLALPNSDRRVFALLAARAGDQVSTDAIRAELWGETWPRSAVQTVQTYVLHLRKRIGRDAIVTTNAGYLMPVSRFDVDAHRFDHLVTKAKRSMDVGDLRSATDALRAGLSLWNGGVLEDIRRGALLEAFAVGMEDRRATALGIHYDIELQSGRHRDVVDELAALARSDPAREDWTERLMLALYRSRRAAEALQAYRRLRAALSEEHGMDPCSGLQRLHQQILAGDPKLDLNGETQ